MIGWYFDVTVRHPLDYSRYPLDYMTVWLRVWPKEFDAEDRVLLVPDLETYFDSFAGRFGLDQDIVTGEWEIHRSFFAYRDVPYAMRFGHSLPANAGIDREVFAEFFCNLGATRKFINAFIVNLVPLFVVALLLFGAVLRRAALAYPGARRVRRLRPGLCRLRPRASPVQVESSERGKMLWNHRIRADSPDPIGSGSALVYIEYFCLVMYCAILLTALNSYVFSLTALRGTTILHWRDNLLPKLLFWPSLLWAMAIVSLAVL